MRKTAAGPRGQALLETALTIPFLFSLTLGFLAVLVRVEAQIELDSATSLAAAAAVSAPAASPLSARYARATWLGTLRHYPYLEPGRLSGCGAYAAGALVTCTGQATLRYSQTPMGTVIPVDLGLEARAAARGSAFRSR